MRGLAAPGTFDVHDGDDRLWNIIERNVAAGLEQDFVSALEQPLHERIDLLLQQRFAARDLDELRLVAIDLREHVVDRDLPAAGKRVWRIAPPAPEIAGGQADEHARTADVRRFTLDRKVDLVDGEHNDRCR